MIDLNFKYKSLIDELNSISPFKTEIAIILGSGLGDFTSRVKIIKEVDTTDLSGYPASTVEGHKGKIIWAEHKNRKLLLFSGRIHFYEGYKISDCLLPVFISHKLNCKSIFLTNAAGGISSFLEPGDLMLNTSYNGIFIKPELTQLLGVSSLDSKNNFINFPDEEINSIIRQSAKEQNIDLKEGVYWYTKGPSYETPSEVRFINKFGGDAVGMSTVHEAVFAKYLGLKTASISCITNFAAGISNQKLSHSEVTETANKVKEKFAHLVLGMIEKI